MPIWTAQDGLGLAEQLDAAREAVRERAEDVANAQLQVRAKDCLQRVGSRGWAHAGLVRGANAARAGGACVFCATFDSLYFKPLAQQQVQRLDTEYRALRDEMDKEVGATGETAEKIKVRSVALTWQPRM